MGDVPASPTRRRGRSEEVYWRSAVEIPSLSLMEHQARRTAAQGTAETSPIVDQFENREDGSSRECPDADDPSAEIGVSDDCIDFMRDVTAVIFSRHGPNYLP